MGSVITLGKECRMTINNSELRIRN